MCELHISRLPGPRARSAQQSPARRSRAAAAGHAAVTRQLSELLCEKSANQLGGSTARATTAAGHGVVRPCVTLFHGLCAGANRP